MTKAELLEPRYKVVADYPHSNFEINQILDTDAQGVHISYEDYGKEYTTLADYPHLFKKLEWWEDRKDKNLPKYIKKIDSGAVYEVEWNKYKNTPKCIFIWYSRLGLTVNLSGQDQDLSLLKIYEPATLEEYLKQNNG